MNTTSESVLSQLSNIQSILNTITSSITTTEEPTSVSSNDSKIDKKILEAISKKMQTIIMNDPYVRANAIMATILSDHIGIEMADNFVSSLNSCRIRGNYMPMTGYYYKVKHSEKLRNLLLMCSALYRLKFNGNRSNESALKSIIKYSTMCPHCGDAAKEIKDRFDQIEVNL